MRVRVSQSGEVVLPGFLVEQLGIGPGNSIEATLDAGRIMLAPTPVRGQGAGIVTDPITGLPVLSGGEGAPALTSEMVVKLLVDFP